MNKILTVYKNEVFDFINKDFEVQTLADDCLFTEGPVWNTEGFYLFSDITANCIYKIAEDGTKEVFVDQSGTDHEDDPLIKKDQAGSNGLAYDWNGELLVCQHGSHAISILRDKKLETFIGSYKNRAFNSPNDLIVHTSQRIYFSDPPYGLRDGQLNPAHFQPLAGVYCWTDGVVQLVCDRYKYPNGVCLSPDEKILFICSNKPQEKFVSMYDTSSHLFLGVFAEENGDGIETDPHGNIYLCSNDGIIILNSKGERLALISLPAIPANACWGGKEGKDLLITAREFVYLIRGLRS